MHKQGLTAKSKEQLSGTVASESQMYLRVQNRKKCIQ